MEDASSSKERDWWGPREMAWEHSSHLARSKSAWGRGHPQQTAQEGQLQRSGQGHW